MIRNSLKKSLYRSAAFVALFVISPVAVAQISTDSLSVERAIVMQDSALDPLANTPEAIGRFISKSKGISLRQGSEIVLSESFAGLNGRTHMRMHQEIDGLRVHGAYIKATLDRDGKLMHLIERTAPNPAFSIRIPASITEFEAINSAVTHNFGDVGSADFFYTPPKAEEVLIARKSGLLEHGFLIETWGKEDNRLYETLVGAKGEIVSSELRTADDSYNIYADHPGVSTQRVTAGPGNGNAQSPSGWLSGAQTTRQIRGNNAFAYLDRNADNIPDTGGTSVTNGNFLATHNPAQAATTSANQDVAVQNLFYLTNIIHDDLYAHGFIEATGNFQENNFNRGGLGSDSVNAEAQDGSGTNNANFSTPSDGSNPRMQMFLWTTTNPGRDGDLDSDIVWHEYGHGLTWRMIGGMSGSVSGAIGEGMGDVLALYHNNRDTVGSYSTANPRGIRSETYTDYTRTIGDFRGTGSPHFDGELYAATLWRLRELGLASGLTSEGILDFVIDGMNFTPSGPDYLDMRDGILAASSNATDCLVWEAFADFGMGVGARFSTATGGITESFNVPSTCNGVSIGIGSLTGSAVRNSNSRWTATATVTLDTAISGVVVNATWRAGTATAPGTCTTNTSGRCAVTIGPLSRSRTPSLSFTVNTINGETATGSPLSITINRR